MRRITLLISLTAVLVLVPAASAKNVVLGTVGPGFTITLKTTAGKPVKTLKAGRWTFVVTDKAAIHDFHLVGPGVNKVITTVSFVGKKTVTLKLKPGRYIFQCDPHASGGMKGSFRVTA